MPKTILFISANPPGTERLRLDQEMREIKNSLDRAKLRDHFKIKFQSATREKDLQRALLEHKPDIVHFSCHGNDKDGIVLEDENGQPCLVLGEQLRELLDLFKVECVLLNACHSEIHAKAIAEAIPYVIGMPDALRDDEAIKFAVSFYDALGAGRSTEFAYSFACYSLYPSRVSKGMVPQLFTPESSSPEPIPGLPKSKRDLLALTTVTWEKGTIIMKQYTVLATTLIAVFLGLAVFALAPWRGSTSSKPVAVISTPSSSSVISNAWPPSEGILATVKQRGHLRCGIEGGLPLFSLNEGEATRENDGTLWYDKASGFDADYCRVIAASVFGKNYSANSVKFIPLKSDNRFEAVQSGRVDVLVRNTTHTVGRGSAKYLDFGPTIFYDGQDVLVHAGIESFAELNNQKVCVTHATTTVSNLDAVRAKRQDVHFDIIETNERGEWLVDNDDLKAEFEDGNCDAISADRSQLVVIQASTGGEILGENLSKEPLAPAYVYGDKQWSDVVDYSIYATIYAAELNISQATIEEFLEGETDIRIKQFLGMPDDRISGYIGSTLGLDPKFVQSIVSNVGNYKDIYYANFLDKETEELVFPETLNKIYDATTGTGLLYSPPFLYPNPEELEQLSKGTQSAP